jgi:hypothetical protein
MDLSKTNVYEISLRGILFLTYVLIFYCVSTEGTRGILERAKFTGNRLNVV